MFLHLQVVEACDVPKMDVLSASDPYCQITYTGQNVLTTPVQNDTATPVWNSVYKIPVTDMRTDILIITMFDSNSVGSDTLIAKLVIDVNSLAEGEVVDKWYEMESAQTQRKAPRIRLVIQLGVLGRVPFSEY